MEEAQFAVTPERGFLPRCDPLEELPAAFDGLSALLDEMPFARPDGTPGLLARGALRQASAAVPDYTAAVEAVREARLLSALFRDYTFWASAYLLEGCHLSMLATNAYGLGEERLPANIARPLVAVADRLQMKPFMEYATSYALYNWRRLDKTKGVDYENLRTIRSFTGMASEHAFILVHVAMVAHTPRLVTAILHALGALEGGVGEQQRLVFDDALRAINASLAAINGVMETMWRRSAPGDYKYFRTFIMGTKGQPMFPCGVTYEGVTRPGTWSNVQLRGESGANDSIIPAMDNFLGLADEMPSNELTEILRDFRSYRPIQHTAFLTDIEERSRRLGVAAFAAGDVGGSFMLLLEALDHVRDFRLRHWNFAREYIIKHSEHPVATGGSPIKSWLPNQLVATLAYTIRLLDGALSPGGGATPAQAERLTVMRAAACARRDEILAQVQQLAACRSLHADPHADPHDDPHADPNDDLHAKESTRGRAST